MARRERPADVDLFGRRPRRRPDWSHRRGEPPGLALAWTLYLMLATLGSLTPAVTAGRFEPDVYRPAARILMVMIVVGLCVLWPMLRLSQRAPERAPGRLIARDLPVLLLPALTLAWPQVLLAGWSVGVLGVLSALLVVWTMLAGLAVYWWYALTRGGWFGRAAGMSFVLLIVAAAPLVLWKTSALSLSPAAGHVTPGWMLTPVTSVWEVVRDRGWSGRPARVYTGHWWWVAGLGLWTAAAWGASIWSYRLAPPMLSDRRKAGEQ